MISLAKEQRNPKVYDRKQHLIKELEKFEIYETMKTALPELERKHITAKCEAGRFL